MVLRVVTFKLDEEELNVLDRYAAAHGKYRSEVIRKAIREYIGIDGGSRPRKKEKKGLVVKKISLLDPPDPPSNNNSNYVVLDRSCEEVESLRARGWGWYSIGRQYGVEPTTIRKWYLKNCSGGKKE